MVNNQGCGWGGRGGKGEPHNDIRNRYFPVRRRSVTRSNLTQIRTDDLRVLFVNLVEIDGSEMFGCYLVDLLGICV